VADTLEGSRRAPSMAPDEPGRSVQHDGESTRRRALILVLVALVAFFALSAFLYVFSAHAFLPDSDGATVVLEGNAIVHGDVALHGWSLSLDSFWLLDALYYAVAVAIVGIHGYLLHLVPAIIAALVIVAGAMIARDGRRGLIGLVGAAVVVIVLALPTHLLAYFFLRGPLHIDTVLCCLIAFAALSELRFKRWRWVLAVVFLAAAALGDLQTIALGTIPLFIGGVVAALRSRRATVGLPATTAALASVVLAVVGREIAKAFGTFHLIKANPRATYSVMFGSNLKLAGHYFADIVGVGSTSYGNGGAPASLSFGHAVVLVAIIASVLIALFALAKGVLVGSPRDEDALRRSMTDDLLVIAALGGLVVFLALTTAPIWAYGRYLVPSLIFAVILMGRFATRIAAHFASSREVIPRVIPLAAIAVALAITGVLACGAGFELAQAKPFDPFVKVAAFLEHHHLHQGIGDYWSSSIVTVESNNSVVVRAVTATPRGKLVRYDRESQASWYAGHKFQFMVLNPTLNFGNVNVLTASATFGKPAHSWIVYGYEVLVWHHTISVSSHGIT
jgi:hypothetical protein